MRVLVFSRGDYYTNIMERTCYRNDFFVVTDAVYTFPTRRFDYCLSSTLNKYAYCGYTYFSDEELFNIVRRDRYLRRIALREALDYVYNVTGQLLHIFQQEKPDVIFSHYPDSFTQYIMYKIAAKTGVHSVALVAYAIPGYFMFFDYNKKVFYRRANKIELLDLYDTFASKASKMSHYVVQNRGVIKELLYRLRAIPGPMWVWLRFNSQLNCDTRNRNFYAMCCSTGAIPPPRLNIRDLNTKGYYARLDDVKSGKGQKIIYISLHYYPEASIDYISESTQLIDHDRVVVDILRNFSDRYIFVVKEHPAMYNLRNLALYEKTKKFPNVYLLHPATNYVDIIKKSDVIISWGGSVGLEAPFYGKRTLNIIKPLYHVDGFNNYFLDYNDLVTSFIYKVDTYNYDIKTYCSALYNLLIWTLFVGDYGSAAAQTDEKSINNIAHELNVLFSTIVPV